MTFSIKTMAITLCAACFSLQALANQAHHHQDAESEHNPEVLPADTHDNHGDHQTDTQSIQLTAQQMAMAQISVNAIYPQVYAFEVYAPAEIRANGYSSYLISPRVDSVVMKRHVSLGEQVEKQQPLVTLFSETVAQAQADYRLDYAEWQRVRHMQTATVSQKQLSEAQTRFVAARAKLLAFGLDEQALTELTKDNASPLGEYTLYAAQAGSVLNDDFQQGQRVQAGEALLTLADESNLWVEARLSANSRLDIPPGARARISIQGKSYAANVIQEAHTVDQVTRTRVVRLLVSNEAHELHSGMFADCFFQFATQQAVMAVPDSALWRNAEGHWTLFLQEAPGEFVATEVKPGRRFGEYREVSGLAEGTKVVTEGAFFVASEQAKSGFEPHNH